MRLVQDIGQTIVLPSYGAGTKAVHDLQRHANSQDVSLVSNANISDQFLTAVLDSISPQRHCLGPIPDHVRIHYHGSKLWHARHRGVSRGAQREGEGSMLRGSSDSTRGASDASNATYTSENVDETYEA
jgi:hypothetical protein